MTARRHACSPACPPKSLRRRRAALPSYVHGRKSETVSQRSPDERIRKQGATFRGVVHAGHAVVQLSDPRAVQRVGYAVRCAGPVCVPIHRLGGTDCVDGVHRRIRGAAVEPGGLMLHETAIVLTAFVYLGVLFAIAYYADERADAGRSVIASPYIYSLSLAVYATAWTFYGSVV